MFTQFMMECNFVTIQKLKVEENLLLKDIVDIMRVDIPKPKQ